MSGPGAGYEYPAQEVSWQKRDVLLFANSIGIKADELHFLYVRFVTVFREDVFSSLSFRSFIPTSRSSRHIL
jgi:hypothetical protein